MEQRDNISVPVLAAVGGGSGRSDPKIDDSVYRTSKKPEAKAKPLTDKDNKLAKTLKDQGKQRAAKKAAVAAKGDK